MILYELDKSDVKWLGVEQAIRNGLYIIRDDKFITQAFNFGNGTKKHMNRYMKDNSWCCVWINAETMEQVNRI